MDELHPITGPTLCIVTGSDRRLRGKVCAPAGKGGDGRALTRPSELDLMAMLDAVEDQGRAHLGVHFGMGDNSEAFGVSPVQCFDAALTSSPQGSAMGRASGVGAARADEPDFACKHDRVRFAPCVMKPWGRGAIWRQSEAVPVCKELIEPRDKRIPATKRWVHPDKASPAAFQRPCVEPIRTRHEKRPLLWRSNIKVEIASKRIKQGFWSVPFVRLPDAEAMDRRHSSLPISKSTRPTHAASPRSLGRVAAFWLRDGLIPA